MRLRGGNDEVFTSHVFPLKRCVSDLPTIGQNRPRGIPALYGGTYDWPTAESFKFTSRHRSAGLCPAFGDKFF